MKGVCGRIRNGKAPMLSRIAAQKDAEHASQADLESVARLKTSRAAGLALAPKAAGAGNSGLSRNTPPWGSVEDNPDCVVAHAEEETEVIPFGEYGARSPIYRNLPRHQVGPWTVMQGGGNDRGEGFGL